MIRRSRQGIALITALAILVVVGGISAIMFARTVTEVQHSGDDTGIVQSLLIARGAANMAGAVLQGPVRLQLDALVTAESSTSSRWSFGTGNSTSTEPTPTSVSRVLSTNADSLANMLQTAIDAQLCGAAIPGLSDGGQVELRIHVTDTACSTALPGDAVLPTGRFIGGSPRDGSGSANDQTYALPFVVVARGAVGPYSRTIVTSGEYQFTVGRGSFAQYALFTNVHTTETGQDIWFTQNTLFDGPVHTNQRFRFYRDPWFGGRTTSAGCVNPGATSCTGGSNAGAFFYGEGFRTVGQMAPTATAPSYANGFGTHAPDLAGGVGWNADFVPLPSNSQDQRQAAQNAGLAYPRTFTDSWFRLEDDLTLLELSATDAAGNPVPADGSLGAVYQEIRACYLVRLNGNFPTRTRCDVYRYGSDLQVERRSFIHDTSSGNPGKTESVIAQNPGWIAEGAFNGVVHVDGEIDRMRGPARTPAGSNDPDDAPPAIASFAQITIAAEDGARITGDLKYEDVPCEGTPRRESDGSITTANCNNLNATNILGVYSQGGDVLIGHNNTGSGGGTLNAPQNVTIHGVLMTSTGIVGVERFDTGSPRGDVNLIGGVIEYHYGAFGTFNASTGQMSTGYSRAFAFDQRTAAGLAPPYFPTIGQDSVRDIVTFAFGQREQVE
jgi:hypothetical protein